MKEAALQGVLLLCCSLAGICSWAPKEGPEASSALSPGAVTAVTPAGSAAEARQGSGAVTSPGDGTCPASLGDPGQGCPQSAMQLVICIPSHMDTRNDASDCSSQPARVQNRESYGDRRWGWGEKIKIKYLPKIDSVTRKRQGKKNS